MFSVGNVLIDIVFFIQHKKLPSEGRSAELVEVRVDDGKLIGVGWRQLM